jgi:hypothetical protein
MLDLPSGLALSADLLARQTKIPRPSLLARDRSIIDVFRAREHNGAGDDREGADTLLAI